MAGRLFAYRATRVIVIVCSSMTLCDRHAREASVAPGETPGRTLVRRRLRDPRPDTTAPTRPCLPGRNRAVPGRTVRAALTAAWTGGREHVLRMSPQVPHDFLLPPLPNHLFTRDNSCWVYGRVSVNPMAKAYYGGDDASHLPASVEGGDVHVLGHGAVTVLITDEDIRAAEREQWDDGTTTWPSPPA
jgi:hypothetical protein